MKTEMEKQEREHQQSSAEAAVKHSVELKDLGRKRTGIRVGTIHGTA